MKFIWSEGVLMAKTQDEQINQLKQTIADIESQRSILGDEAVDVSLAPFHQKLAELEAQIEPSIETPKELPSRQRKLVTLLFMDVVGSTAITQHLDPEDNLEIMENALLRKTLEELYTDEASGLRNEFGTDEATRDKRWRLQRAVAASRTSM